MEVALKSLEKILGIKQKPDLFKVNVLEKCIPQYVIGHTKRVERIENYISSKNLKISLCGSSYYGVGVNDVIHLSKTAVDSMKLR